MRLVLKAISALSVLGLALGAALPAGAQQLISRLPTATTLSGNETVPVILPDGKTMQRATTNTLVSLISLIHWKGAWSSSTAYVVNDVVSSNGSSYIAIQAGTNHAVTDTAYWNVLAQAGANGTGTGSVTSVTCGTGLSGGTFTTSGSCSITAPVPVNLGGTGATSGSGSVMDALSGFTGTGFLLRSGAGSYGFITTPLPAANGGTGLTSGTSGGVNCWTGTTTIASSALLTQYALIVGGGAGACPQPLASLGTSTTVLHGNASGPPAFSSIVWGDVSSLAATSAQFTANTGSVVGTPNALWGAAVPVALTDGATITADFSAGLNFSVTIAGNRTMAAPLNVKAGQTGAIRIAQDSTGSRTMTWNSAFKWASGTPCVLSTGASKIDYVFFFAFSSSEVLLSCALDVR